MSDNNDSYIDKIDSEQEKKEETVEELSFGQKMLKEILSWAKMFIIAFLIAVLVNNFILLNATVPSGSMIGTIMEGDQMMGNRLAYKFGSPDRGDVVIFKFPDDEEQLFVKRVIGLPGEKVTIRGNKIYINDSEKPLKEDYINEQDWGLYENKYDEDGNLIEETPIETVYEVPQGCYFMLGDNRNNSHDSRAWNHTFVREDKILAEALFIYYPLNRFGWVKSADYE